MNTLKKKSKKKVRRRRKGSKTRRKRIELHIDGSKTKIRKKRRKKRRKRRKRKKIDWEVWNQPFYTSRRCGCETFIRRSLEYMKNVGKSNEVARRKKYNQIRDDIFNLIKKKKVFPDVCLDEAIDPLKEVNIDLYTHENLRKREELFENRRIKFWIFCIYKNLKKNQFGDIERFVYLEVLKIAHRMLLRKYHKTYLVSDQNIDLEYYCSEDFLREDDFNQLFCQFTETDESDIESSVPWEQFYKGMFEIADAWTNSVNEGDYVKFIKRLLRRICVVMKIRRYKIHKMKRIYGINSSQVIEKYEKRVICDEKGYDRVMETLRKTTESQKFGLSSPHRFRKYGTRSLTSRKRLNMMRRRRSRALKNENFTRKELEQFSVEDEQEFMRNLRESNNKIIRSLKSKKRKEKMSMKRRERKMKRKKKMIARRKRRRLRELLRGKSLNRSMKKRPTTSTGVSSRYLKGVNEEGGQRRNTFSNLIDERKEVKVKTVTFDLMEGVVY